MTAKDLLNPQEGDHVVQGTWHIDTVFELYGILRGRYESRPDVLVSSDLKMFWGIPGLDEPAPDLSVIFGIRDKKKDRGSFKVAQEGTRPSLVVEVVSKEPEHVTSDHVKKVKIYQRAGIPEYVIFDSPSPRTRGRCRVRGLRLDARGGEYQEIVPDAEGRILSETTGLLFGVSPEGDRALLFDAVTGERLLTASEELTRLKEKDKKG